MLIKSATVGEVCIVNFSVCDCVVFYVKTFLTADRELFEEHLWNAPFRRVQDPEDNFCKHC